MFHTVLSHILHPYTYQNKDTCILHFLFLSLSLSAGIIHLFALFLSLVTEMELGAAAAETEGASQGENEG